MSELRTKLLEGVPYYGMDGFIDKTELEAKAKHVEEAAGAMHHALYQAHAENNPRVVVFDDEASKYNAQYISVKDKHGKPCYGPWDGRHPATDIGLRGVNPDFEFNKVPPKDRPNFTTVIHADRWALADYRRRGAPQELLDALDTVVLFNNFIVKEIAEPYLTRVAEAFGKRPKDYVMKFLPRERRARTLTRAILYHLDALPGMREISETDGAELLIKEHRDKSSYTIDAMQSSKGLEYLVDGIWREASPDKIACFRGTADDELTEDSKDSLTPPTWHRAVVREDLPDVVSPHLVKHGLARIALPTFVSLSTPDARVVQANSAETHGISS